MSATNNVPPAPKPPVISPTLVVFTPQGMQNVDVNKITPPIITAELSSSTSFPVSAQWQWRTTENDDWENVMPEMVLPTFTVLNLMLPSRVTKQYRVIIANDAGSIISPIVTFSFAKE